MKILFFHRWVGVHGGGTETHVLELVKRFALLGHAVTILTREGARLADLDNSIRVIRISRSFRESDHSYDDFRVYIYTFFYMLKSALKLLMLRIRGEVFDVVSVHFAVEAIIARIYRFITGTPFVFVLEGYTPLEAKTARHANSRIAISNFEAGIYKKRHGVDSEVLYVGVDTKRFFIGKDKGDQFRKCLVPDGEILILTVCRIEPRKDLFTLIKAAKILKERGEKLKFVIVGDGILKEEITRLIKNNNLQDYVIMAGFVSDDELPEYYAAADIFLLTSKEEWFGIVFLEAMSAGLPIITTDVDACPEVVGECGLFFRRGDFFQLIENITSLTGNPDLLSRLSLKAQERSKIFNWNSQIIKYQRAYENAAKK